MQSTSYSNVTRLRGSKRGGPAGGNQRRHVPTSCVALAISICRRFQKHGKNSLAPSAKGLVLMPLAPPTWSFPRRWCPLRSLLPAQRRSKYRESRSEAERCASAAQPRRSSAHGARRGGGRLRAITNPHRGASGRHFRSPDWRAKRRPARAGQCRGTATGLPPRAGRAGPRSIQTVFWFRPEHANPRCGESGRAGRRKRDGA